jgi:hypothetical protein
MQSHHEELPLNLDPQSITAFFFWRFIHVQCLVLLVNEYTVYILLCPHTNAQGVVLMFFPHFLSLFFCNIMNIRGHDEGVSRGLHTKPSCFHNFLLVQPHNLAIRKTLPNACFNPICCFFDKLPSNACRNPSKAMPCAGLPSTVT